MTHDKLKQILAKHKLWLDSGAREGERADLRNADLCDADLTGANLTGTILERMKI